MRKHLLTIPLPIVFLNGRDRPRKRGPERVLRFPPGATIDLELAEYPARAMRAAGWHECVALDEQGDVAAPLTQAQVDALLDAVEDGSLNDTT
jgi:hypothetical protein